MSEIISAGQPAKAPLLNKIGYGLEIGRAHV